MPKNPAYRIRKKRGIFNIPVLKRSKSSRLVLSSILLTGLVSISVIVLAGTLIYKSVTKSFVSAFSSNSQDLSSMDIFTLMEVDVDSINAKSPKIENIRFYMFQKNSNKLVTYTVDPKIKIDMPGNLADEEISKSFQLGMMNEGSDLVEQGVGFLRRSVSKLFGFKVDRYILVNNSYAPEFQSFFDTGVVSSISNLKSVNTFKENVKTDLTIADLIDSQKFLSQLPEERVYKYDFKQQYTEDTSDLDEVIREINSGSTVEHEQLAVSVLNGSGKSGLATYGARVVENMNVRVLSVGNSNDTYEKSVIVTDDPASETVSWLKNVFNISQVVSKADFSKANDPELDRSDAVIILGFDKAGELY